MLNFLKTPSGLFITAIVVLLIVVLISYNRNTIKGWFSTEAGRYSAPKQKIACQKYNNGCVYLGLSVPCDECTKRGIEII